jgi:hypothetical protein
LVGTILFPFIVPRGISSYSHAYLCVAFARRAASLMASIMDWGFALPSPALAEFKIN